MSQSSKKVEWCLRKAKRELEEGNKHRGLVKRDANREEAEKHIFKAEHNLLAIEYFNLGGFSDWSMSAAFYCIYHCFLAIISKFGYESRNQECTIALLRYLKENQKIDLDDIFLQTLEEYDITDKQESSVIERREFYTYGTSISCNDKEEIEKSIKLCKECIDKTKNIIFEE